MKNEIQVNIRDLINCVVKRWRTHLIIGIIGAISICGIYAIKTINSDAHELQSEIVTDEKLKSDLTQSQILEVEEAVELKKVSTNHMIALREYMANSILYKINATEAPTYRMAFVFYDQLAKEDNQLLSEVLTMVNDCIYSENVIQDIAKSAGLLIDGVFVRELIQIETININNIIIFKVLGTDEKMCKDISNVVHDYVHKIIIDLKKSYELLDYSMIEDEFYTEMNVELLNHQIEVYGQLNNLKTLLGKSYYDFTESQQKYYDYLLDCQEKETIDDEIVDNISDNRSKNTEVLSLMKLFILGGFVGVFFSAVYIALRYLLNDRLKTVEDLTESFSQHVFCSLSLDNFESKAAELQNLEEDILFGSEKKSIRSLLLSGCKSDLDIFQLIEKLKVDLSTHFDNVDIIDFSEEAVNVTKQLRNYDGIICFEKIDNSLYSEIYKEIKKCDYYNIEILGFVVIK